MGRSIIYSKNPTPSYIPRFELRQQSIETLYEVHSVDDHLGALIEPNDVSALVSYRLEYRVEEEQPIEVREESIHLADGPLCVELSDIVALIFGDCYLCTSIPNEKTIAVLFG